MHISLTPELESQIKRKVESGLYNNASEVVREALRFMETHEQLVYQMKLDALRKDLSVGAAQAETGEFVEGSMQSILAEARARRG
ncbi:type II toxin-antitoxin system ParD family antitoxin [Pseudodesulfovibrio thermohalotolerans]|uniref:type II toxin-antitoxin system ParD family antitoxin n=1 Tax=Pseudodesulfovibrio thermohalotolerans TaxID=2880651 RepID=UPI0022B9DBAD|nr:type II toxin-antitoxin system ParD family antitoxin [Pseudodesulfovibrio thermohalotolerans]WFS63388.1 type II toxin-antitoxin system ParD family antitoxin [Pseudodesulfovibrio thermohalotolerans]